MLTNRLTAFELILNSHVASRDYSDSLSCSVEYREDDVAVDIPALQVVFVFSQDGTRLLGGVNYKE